VLLEQAMDYLTEAMYFLEKSHLTTFFAAETLRLYPNNTYVLQYIKNPKHGKGR
jgi:hypothetical protein